MADKLNFYTVDLGYVDLLRVAELKKKRFQSCSKYGLWKTTQTKIFILCCFASS